VSRTLYLTHPEVVIDPNVLTPRWGLSDIGFSRLQAGIDRGIFDDVEIIVASSEQKAIDAATKIATHLHTDFVIDEMCDENDRSSTGFLSANEFEQVADQFFNKTDQSILGWETAQNAQRRIAKAIQTNLFEHPKKCVLFVGHGAVGTLLKCYLGNRKISRDEDQRRMAAKGGGNLFAFDWAAQELQSDWVPIEDWPSPQQ